MVEQHQETGDRHAGTGLLVLLDHLREVHAIDVVGSDDDDDVGVLVVDRLRLWKIASALPRYHVLADPLLRRHGCT